MDNRLTILLLSPVFGAVLCYLAGRVSRRLAGLFATAAVGVSFITALSLASELLMVADPKSAFSTVLGSWISVGEVALVFDLRFDRLTAVMSLIITGVGTLIHIYSIGYMESDESAPRFFAYLNLFVAAMLLLVLGGSLPVLFVGWEGVGVCSYLLIGFWFSNVEYASAGRKAFVMNRIGDLGLMIAMFAIYTAAGTLTLSELSSSDVIAKIPAELLTIAALGLFLAATGKSAQIPLYTWLPDAMAGPTPVSALIHAATMVTAGVYLMARMSGIVEAVPFVPALIVGVAFVTAAVAGTIALVQNDIKKVLAYSTVSQLGLMFIAVGCGAYAAALFHVLTHAFFKAALFLGAGSVIHSCHHEQDMRKMGGLHRYMPLTCIVFMVATLAIAGIWPFAGYHSKHAIISAIYTVSNPLLIPNAGLLGVGTKILAALTAFYMMRCFAMTFLGKNRGDMHDLHEAPMVMTIPVVILGVLSVVAGVLWHSSFFWFLDGVVPGAHGVHSEGAILQSLLGSLPGFFGIGAGVLIFWLQPGLKDQARGYLKPFEWLFAGKYFVDQIYEALIVKPVGRLSSLVARVIDGTFVEGVGGAASGICSASGELVRRMATGQVGNYVLLIVLSVSFFFSIFVER